MWRSVVFAGALTALSLFASALDSSLSTQLSCCLFVQQAVMLHTPPRAACQDGVVVHFAGSCDLSALHYL
jgi:hypothetical protein